MPESNLIAVNLHSYGKFREGAYAHLEKLGVRYVEIGVPGPDQLEAVQQRLRDHGLTASTLQCRCKLTEDTEALRPDLEIGKAMGVNIFFISVKAGEEMSKPEAYRRLRERAELADEYGITLSLETHPDLGENQGEARATLHAVAHPRLRWNLDTANLHYYNQNIDAVEQARKGADLIASVHLKDTNGAYKCWWFPALGDGIIDYKGLFALLSGVGFRGPYTLELEGMEGHPMDETATQAYVARSIQHLRDIGVA